jgi:hypothetical protein
VTLPALTRTAVLAGAVLLPVLTTTAANAAFARATDAPRHVTAAVIAGPVGTTDLYPGTSVAVAFTVTNPNDVPVTFTSVRFAGVTSDDPAACPAGYVTGLRAAPLEITVAALETSRVLTVPGAVTMRADAPDGCQGRTFALTTTLTGAAG